MRNSISLALLLVCIGCGQDAGGLILVHITGDSALAPVRVQVDITRGSQDAGASFNFPNDGSGAAITLPVEYALRIAPHNLGALHLSITAFDAQSQPLGAPAPFDVNMSAGETVDVNLSLVELNDMAVPSDMGVLAIDTGDGGEILTPDGGSGPTVTVVDGESFQFSSNLANVVWSVVESNGGTIDQSGLYTAPMTSGTYHVKANTTTEGNQSSEVTVNVVPGLVLLAGKLGGNGHLDGVGAAARFDQPYGVSYVSDASTKGSLYVADSNNHVIRKIDVATGAVSTFAGGQSAVQDGVGISAGFTYPCAITNDGTYLYVTDGAKIRRITLADQTVSTLMISGAPFANNNMQLQCPGPAGIVYDSSRNALYVSDTESQGIRLVTLSNLMSTTIAGGSSGFADGPGLSAQFYYPVNLVLDDSATTLYVADVYNHAIRAIDTTTLGVTTVVGASPTAMMGMGNGPALSARLARPTGLWWSSGILYIADTGNARIAMLDTVTGTISTLAGPTTSGMIDNVDGVGGAARFALPCEMAGDNQGHLFVADFLGETVRQIDIGTQTPPVGTVTTLAGAALNTGSNGTGSVAPAVSLSDARFSRPYQLAYDGLRNNLYVADNSNHMLRKIALGSGQVSIVAAALAVQPTALALDVAANQLYLSGTGNGSIYKLDLSVASPTVTTFTNGFITPAGLALVDSASNKALYVADSGANAVYSCPVVSGTCSPFRTGVQSASAIAAVGAYLYVNQNKQLVQYLLSDSTPTAAPTLSYSDVYRFVPSQLTTDGSSLYVADSYEVDRLDLITGTRAVLLADPLNVVGTRLGPIGTTQCQAETACLGNIGYVPNLGLVLSNFSEDSILVYK